MPNKIVVLCGALLLGVVAGAWWWRSTPRSLETPETTSREEVPSAESAEVTAFAFMQDVLLVMSGTEDPLVASRLYESLSGEAKTHTSPGTIPLNITSFVGIESAPEQGISVEDLQIESETTATLLVGLNYTSGRTLRAVHLVAEEGRWNIDSVEVRDDRASEPPSDPPPSGDTKPGTGQNPTPIVPGEPPKRDTCHRDGCSGQVCTDDPDVVMTTCEWREEYACYRSAICERQANGACGWTQTTELLECLASTRHTLREAL